MGFDATPKWNSPGAAAVPTACADMWLMDFCQTTNRWDEIGKHALCALLRTECLLVRSKSQPGKWLFSLGDIGGVCGAGWPAVERCDEDGMVCYAPKSDSRDLMITPVVVLSPDDWEAMAFRWVSPLEQAILLQEHGAGVQSAILAVPLADPEPLHVVVAANGWWKLPATTLKAIQRDLGSASDTEAGLFETLKKLTHDTLHEERRVCEALQCRLVDEEFNVEECLNIDGAEELFEAKEDRDEIDRMKRSAAASREESRSLATEILAYKRKVFNLPAKADPNPRHKASPLYKVCALAKVPAGGITQPQLKQLLPPGAHCWAGRLGSGCWSVHLPPYPRFSKAWTVAGHRGAALECLRHVWSLWLRDNHLELSACPVRGIFDE